MDDFIKMYQKSSLHKIKHFLVPGQLSSIGYDNAVCII